VRISREKTEHDHISAFSFGEHKFPQNSLPLETSFFQHSLRPNIQHINKSFNPLQVQHRQLSESSLNHLFHNQRGNPFTPVFRTKNIPKFHGSVPALIMLWIGRKRNTPNSTIVQAYCSAPHKLGCYVLDEVDAFFFAGVRIPSAKSGHLFIRGPHQEIIQVRELKGSKRYSTQINIFFFSFCFLHWVDGVVSFSLSMEKRKRIWMEEEEEGHNIVGRMEEGRLQ